MAPLTLFEVSWEVGTKVGGIHTVISTKAKTLVERYGDQYIAVGPWPLSREGTPLHFSEEPGFEAFGEACRALGVPVRVGRWHIPGRPRTILIEFSRLFERKDEVLGRLWEDYEVDSLSGGWDYVEPVMFGHAAGIVIEKWLTDFGAAGGVVAQFHEWMTGAGLLYLRKTLPEIGTVFTTHATMLGRSLAARGTPPWAPLGASVGETVKRLGITAKHSMESVCARETDVLTTVSEMTAAEAEVFHGRRPEPILPNGIDLAVMDEFAGRAGPGEVAARLREFARRFLGEDVADAALVCTSGRYEFHNKGIDVLLDAAARLETSAPRRIVLFVLVPAGNSGPRQELLARLRESEFELGPPLGLTTHHLFDAENDPVHRRCQELGLRNAPGSRVKVIQIPSYLNGADGALGLTYEAALRGMDLSCFPSFYEPWGYTPQESLSLGVPTITTDLSGFGAWAMRTGLGFADGVTVLERRGADDAETARRLAAAIERCLREAGNREATAKACRTAVRTAEWSDLIVHYETAFGRALSTARERHGRGPRRLRRHFPLVAVGDRTAAQRPRLNRFEVATSLPPGLEALERLSRNLWWCWNHDAERLFADIAPAKWEECGRNPVLFLDRVFAADLRKAAADASFVARLQKIAERFDRYMAQRWPADAGVTAYFCAEFGLHESLPIYSGGLGILAGDHLKSASDLGLPLVGIGLFYRRGYLRQQLTASGDQIGAPIDNEPRRLPIELVLDAQRKPLRIELRLPSSVLVLQVWRVMVGRVSLYLLDADVPQNRPEDRGITHHLYGGDAENRLRQEIVLGRGGVRLLQELGIEPTAWHLNEGHAAFVAIERLSRYVRHHGLSFDEARALVRASTAFTTHTPVPAGHDCHGEHLMRRYFSNVQEWAGVPWERFFPLGTGANAHDAFNMTYFACRFASVVNGVSRLHAQVSRKILHPVWPMLLQSEVPVLAITNGVHLPTWTSPAMARLLGATDRPVRARDFAERAAALPAPELWATRTRLRERLRHAIVQRTEQAFRRRNDSRRLLARTLAGLEGDALLVGFARRFAPYKRADLVLRDPERLRRLLDHSQRPVRLLFAGKAHPADGLGQEILRRVAQLARTDEFAGRVFLLEDYDMDLARALVQGVDVWLNNPIRPLEASGTSGMKAAANGVLNLSIADGWWPEVAADDNGWTIGTPAETPSPELRDAMQADHVYELLEEQIAPLFFERDEDGVPGRWLERVRRCLATVPTWFETDRMVGEYRDLCYQPLTQAFRALGGAQPDHLRRVTDTHQAIRRGFSDVIFRDVRISDLRAVEVTDTIEMAVDVELGGLRPDDVRVEFVLGRINGDDDLHDPVTIELHASAAAEGGPVSFTGSKVMEQSGTFGYGVRIRTRQREPVDEMLGDLVLWADARPLE
jgi:phosphorylase/glycogen(starch) synthase